MITKLQLTNEDGVITIETNQDVTGIDNFINHLVRPVLKAVGYTDGSVNRYIGDFEDVASMWGDFRPLQEGAPYVDPYDAPVAGNKKKKQRK